LNIHDVRAFRRTLRRFERATAAQVKNCCSRVSLAQCVVLLEIDEVGELSMGDLARRVRLDASTLSRTVDGLVSRKLVSRRGDAGDRRVVRIRLTRRGQAVCGSIHEENDAHCRRVFARIPPSRRATIIRGFETLVQAYLDCESDAAVAPSREAQAGSGSRGSKGVTR